MTLSVQNTYQDTSTGGRAPSGTQLGDLLIANVVCSWSSFTYAGYTNGGWTLLLKSHPQALFWKIADAGDVDDGSQTTYSIDSGGYAAVVTISGFRDADPTNPVEAHQWANTMTAPSVTSSSRGKLLVAVAAVYGSGVNSLTPPSGYTALGSSVQSSNAVCGRMGYKTAAPSTTHPAATFTKSVTSTYNDRANHLVIKEANQPPTATFTAPAAGSTHDPRLPLTVSWNYSDPEGAAQTQREVGWRVAGGSWSTLVSGASTASSYEIPANTLTDVKSIELRVRVHDGTAWGPYVTRTITADSWTYGPEITSAVASGSIDTTGFEPGLYDVQVATADEHGLGAYSATDQVTVVTTNVHVFNGTAFEPKERFVRVGTSWVQSNPALK